jgi:hypothetical protein
MDARIQYTPRDGEPVSQAAQSTSTAMGESETSSPPPVKSESDDAASTDVHALLGPCRLGTDVTWSKGRLVSEPQNEWCVPSPLSATNVSFNGAQLPAQGLSVVGQDFTLIYNQMYAESECGKDGVVQC